MSSHFLLRLIEPSVIFLFFHQNTSARHFPYAVCKPAQTRSSCAAGVILMDANESFMAAGIVHLF